MSDFGILLSTGSGQPFVTPISTPMALYGRYEINSHSASGAQVASVEIPWVSSRPAMGFVRSNVAGSIVGSYKTANSIVLSCENLLNRAFTMTGYLFGIFPQPLVDWGIAIWDAAGELVLTNETRVLTDLVTIGDPNIATQSGIGMDITLAGNYAVCPQIHGSTLFQNLNGGTGQPIIVNVTAFTSAAASGGSTRFTAAPSQYPGGSPIGYTDTRCILTAINTAAYD